MVYAMILNLMLSASPVSAQSSQGDMKFQLDQRNWITLNNKYGWKIQYPPCWAAEGVEDAVAQESPQVGIRPSSKCPSDFLSELLVAIETPLLVKPRTAESRVESYVKIKRRYVKRFSFQDIFLKPKVAKAVLNQRLPGEKLLSWHIYTICDGRNLNITLSTDLADPLESVPLEKQILPKLFKRMIETFECIKP